MTQNVANLPKGAKLMVKALSDLQAWILERAARYKRVSYFDVFYYYFKWEPVEPPELWGETYLGKDEATGRDVVKQTPANMVGMPRLRASNFDPDKIGRKKYNSAMASLSRSCARLAARGLVTRCMANFAYIAGVSITDAGRAWINGKGNGAVGQIRPDTKTPEPASIASVGASAAVEVTQAVAPSVRGSELQQQPVTAPVSPDDVLRNVLPLGQVQCTYCHNLASRMLNGHFRWFCPRCGNRLPGAW